jgi:hypothetical protein
MSNGPAAAPLPTNTPSPPPDAELWAADRLGAEGWDSLTTPPDAPTGGGVKRWHELPVELASKWGPGVYRLHWRTVARRSLGQSEAFRVLAPGEQPAQPAQPRPQPEQAAPPKPAGPRIDSQETIARIASLLQSKAPGHERQRQNPPPNMDPITAWDVMEQRAHERHKELSSMQQQGWAMLAQLYQQTADNAIKLATDHRDRVERLYNEKSDELRQQRERQDEREAELRQQLEALRGEFAEQLSELSAEADTEGQPLPATFKDKVQALVQMISTPEGQQVLGIVQQLLTKGADQGQPSPQLPDGGSLPE